MVNDHIDGGRLLQCVVGARRRVRNGPKSPKTNENSGRQEDNEQRMKKKTANRQSSDQQP